MSKRNDSTPRIQPEPYPIAVANNKPPNSLKPSWILSESPFKCLPPKGHQTSLEYQPKPSKPYLELMRVFQVQSVSEANLQIHLPSQLSQAYVALPLFKTDHIPINQVSLPFTGPTTAEKTSLQLFQSFGNST